MRLSYVQRDLISYELINQSNNPIVIIFLQDMDDNSQLVAAINKCVKATNIVLKCAKCDLVKKSALGYLSHIEVILCKSSSANVFFEKKKVANIDFMNVAN